jgi:hypothetical protein
VPAATTGSQGALVSLSAESSSHGSTSTPAGQTSLGAHTSALGQAREDDGRDSPQDAPTAEDVADASIGRVDLSPSGTGAAADASTANPISPAILAGTNVSSGAGGADSVTLTTHWASRSSDADDIESAAATEPSTMISRLAQRGRSGRNVRLENASALVEPALAPDEAPSPHFADLISSCLPFDRATLERAIDQFLDRFEGLAVNLTHLEESTNLLSAVSAVALSALAAEVILRRRRACDERTGAPAADDGDGLAGLPGLPNSWSWGLDET